MHGIDEGELEIGPSDTTPVLYSTEAKEMALRSMGLRSQKGIWLFLRQQAF